MDEFKSLKNQNPPTELFHYTNAESFLGIIGNKELWLSNSIYSNDMGEFEYPRRLLLNRLETRAEEVKLKSYNIEQIRELLSYMKDPMTCVFSLSEKKDQLSQWRGYANSIPGYCIGIKPEYLKAIMIPDAQESFLVKCVYDKNTQIKLLDEIIDDSFSKFEGKSESVIAFDMLSRLITYSPVIKRDDFIEESEWRFIIVALRVVEWVKTPNVMGLVAWM